LRGALVTVTAWGLLLYGFWFLERMPAHPIEVSSVEFSQAVTRTSLFFSIYICGSALRVNYRRNLDQHRANSQEQTHWHHCRKVNACGLTSSGSTLLNFGLFSFGRIQAPPPQPPPGSVGLNPGSPGMKSGTSVIFAPVIFPKTGSTSYPNPLFPPAAGRSESTVTPCPPNR